jgi:hypothetical protein
MMKALLLLVVAVMIMVDKLLPLSALSATVPSA